MNLEDLTPFTPAAFIGSKDRSGYAMTVAVKAALAISPGGVAEPLEEQLFPVGDAYTDDGDPENSSLTGASDLVPHKPNAEVLLHATAYRPADRPTGNFRVGVRVGGLNKQLLVHGERQWEHGMLSSKILDGEPLAAVPITYENAFGGPGFRANPAGRGFKGNDLPYVELPGERLQQVGDKPTPGGFGPLSPAWTPRSERIGTYKGDYLEKQWPGLPDDFDPRFHNAAPADQQLDGYLRGDEEIVLENLHPQVPVLATRLPGWRVVCVREDKDGSKRLIPLVIDTLVIEPDAGRLVLTWRGQAPVSEPDMPEVAQLGFLVEPISNPVRDANAYAATLAELIAERDKEFEPEEPPEEEPDEGETAESPEPEEDGADETDLEIEKLKADIAKMREEAGLPPLPEPDPNAEPPELSPEAQAEYDKIMARLEAEEREAEEEEAAGKWTREKVVEAVAAKTPFEDADLSGLDLSGLDFAGADFRGATLDEVSFANSNLAGAVLAGCSATKAVLDNATLREAHLEGAELLGASLVDARAAGAILVATDLSEAKLDRADMTGAIAEGAQLANASLAKSAWTGTNASGASLAGADATGSDWSEATLAGTDATGADFTGAKLPKANLADAVFAEAKLLSARLDAATATDTDFTEADLSGASLVGADVNGAWLSSAKADQANFEGAVCVDLQLDGASVKNANFKNADITEIRGSQEADLSGSSFRGARGAGAIFESCVLDGCDFSRTDLPEVSFDHASLEKADLSAADLPGARFDYANCRGAVLVDANLLEANFAGTDLTEADIARANMYGVELIDAIISKMCFEGANLRMTKLEQWAAQHGK